MNQEYRRCRKILLLPPLHYLYMSILHVIRARKNLSNHLFSTFYLPLRDPRLFFVLFDIAKFSAQSSQNKHTEVWGHSYFELPKYVTSISTNPIKLCISAIKTQKYLNCFCYDKIKTKHKENNLSRRAASTAS